MKIKVTDVNSFAFGGNVESGWADYPTGLKHIDAGGTHEENPNEGVPMGVAEDGTPNLVEENETIYNDYVFSARLVIPEQPDIPTKEMTRSQQVLKKYQGLTYSEAARRCEHFHGVDERPNDTIAQDSFREDLEVLVESQEEERQKKAIAEMQEQLAQLSPEERELVMQQLTSKIEASQQQGAQDMQEMPQEDMAVAPPTEEMAMPQEGVTEDMQEVPVDMPQQTGMPPMAHGGYLHAEGGDLSSPEEMQQSVEGIAQNAVQTESTSDENPARKMAEEMSTRELKAKLDEIIEWAKQNNDRSLLREAKRLKKKGSREDIEEFVDDALEEMFEEEQMAKEETPVEEAPAEEEDNTVTPPVTEEVPQETAGNEAAANAELAAQGNGNQFAEGGPLSEGQEDVEVPADEVQARIDEAYKLIDAKLKSDGLKRKDFDNYLSKYLKKNPNEEGVTAEILDRVLQEFERENRHTIATHHNTIERKLNRQYAKKDIDVSKLSGAAKAQYQADLQRAIANPDVLGKDDDGVLNIHRYEHDYSSKTRGIAAFSDKADREASDAMLGKIGRKATMRDGKVVLDANTLGVDEVGNYGSYNAKNGLYSFGDDTTVASDNLLSYIDSLGVNDRNSLYDKAGWYDAADFSTGDALGTPAGGDGTFATEEDLWNHYKSRLKERYAALSGQNSGLRGNKGIYNPNRVDNHYLTRDAWEAWAKDLGKSDDARDRKLAEYLGAMYDKDGTGFVESQAYRDAVNAAAANNGAFIQDKTNGARHQTDSYFGIDHVPLFKVLQQTANAPGRSFNRYFYEGPDGNKVYLRNVSDAMRSKAQAAGDAYMQGNARFQDYKVTPSAVNNLLADDYGQAWVLNNTDGLLAAKAGMDVDDSALLPNTNSSVNWWKMAKDKDGNLDGNLSEYPLPSNFPWLLGLGLQGASTLYNILKPTDYGNANAILEAARNAGQYMPVEFNPIGDYLTYRPLDRNYEGNKINAQMSAERNLLSNLSGGNRGTAAAGILASDYNRLKQLAAVDRQAAESNRDHEAKVAEFNRGTNMFNSEGRLKADMANQGAMANAANMSLQGTIQGNQMREQIAQNKANAISAGISGLANSLFGLYQNDFTNKQTKYLLDQGYVPNTYVRGDKRQGAEGGKLRTRRHKLI